MVAMSRISKTKFAQQLGISRRTLNQWEREIKKHYLYRITYFKEGERKQGVNLEQRLFLSHINKHKKENALILKDKRFSTQSAIHSAFKNYWWKIPTPEELWELRGIATRYKGVNFNSPKTLIEFANEYYPGEYNTAIEYLKIISLFNFVDLIYRKYSVGSK